MSRKRMVVIIIMVLIIVSFLKEPFMKLLISKDNNLESKIIHYEEDYQSLKKEYDKLLLYTSKDIGNVISKVVIRDPLLFFDEVTILKGEAEGITLGSAVVNELGLVGIIKKVNKHSSVVELLLNKNTKVAVKIGNITGTLESDNGRLVVKNITNKESIKLNEDITTSNESVLDRDILIGKVKEISNTNQDLSLEIVVLPSVNFDDLDYVYIKEKKSYE